MRKSIEGLLWVAAVLLAPLPGSCAGWEVTASVRLEGDSTLHRYASTATLVRAEARWERADASLAAARGEGLWDSIRAGELKGLEVVVPVADLSSGDKKLDKNMRAALKGAAHPDITFSLERYEVLPGSGGSGVLVRASGGLSIAGETREASLEAAARLDGDVVLLEGRHALRMSEYGIKPPSMMLGAIKTKDEVVVYFGLVLRPKRTDPEERRLP